jgi:hypothetical protein
MTPTEHYDRLDTFIQENRLIREQWEGNNRACLLVALVPDVHKGDYGACPAAVLPEWLARLTPWIDDYGTEERWPEVVRTFARLVRASQYLTAEQWRRLDYRARAIFVRKAGEYGATDVCKRAALLCDRAASGDQPTEEEWAAAAAAAEAAAWAEAADQMIFAFFAAWEAAL